MVMLSNWQTVLNAQIFYLTISTRVEMAPTHLLPCDETLTQKLSTKMAMMNFTFLAVQNTKQQTERYGVWLVTADNINRLFTVVTFDIRCGIHRRHFRMLGKKPLLVVKLTFMGLLIFSITFMITSWPLSS